MTCAIEKRMPTVLIGWYQVVPPYTPTKGLQLVTY